LRCYGAGGEGYGTIGAVERKPMELLSIGMY
jgi:hypothetical protein